MVDLPSPGLTAVPGAPTAASELTLEGLARLGPGNACDAEPIHLSGAVQPHGFLLGVDPSSGLVEVASANVLQYLGLTPAAVLGSGIGNVVGAAAAPSVAALLALAADDRADPLAVELLSGARVEIVAHRSGSLILLEFERRLTEDTLVTTFSDALHHALDPAWAAADVSDICTDTARRVRELTGYDRVLVYRFSDDGYGSVVAESLPEDGSMGALLGLHYPAADIPRQARALFLRKRLRLIPDVDYVPVPLLARAGYRLDELDLTESDLRSVSPSHLGYLHGMGVAATMTVSLICDGRLWGMVMCHHDAPRRVSQGTRAACETLARTLSLQLEVHAFREARDVQLVRARQSAEIVTALGDAASGLHLTAAAADSLAELVDADGVLIRLDGDIGGWGGLVDPGAAEEFIGHVTERARAAAGVLNLWGTDQLHTDGMPTVPGAAEVTGVLVLPIAERLDDVIVWLRREHVRTMAWAGATPADPPVVLPDGTPPSGNDVVPTRYGRTFTPVERQVVGHSRPWTADQLAAAELLGRALPEAMLRRARRLLIERAVAEHADHVAAAETRERLERGLQRGLRLESLGQLAGGIAHDFNNLLAVMLSHAEVVEAEVQDAAQSARDDRWHQVLRDTRQIIDAAGRAAQLTHQLLAFARREVTQPRVLDVNAVVTDLDVLLQRTLGAHISLRVNLSAEQLTVVADPEQLERVVVNLAVNARDAMRGGGVLTITTDSVHINRAQRTDRTPEHHSADGVSVVPGADVVPGRYVRLLVGDNGQGIPADILERVFDPFFTTKGDGEGSGLGLATIHGIVDQAGGRITIESELGSGTSVTVLLPAANVAATAKEAAPAEPTVRSENLLLVEDDPAIREITRRILQRAGYRVVAAASGAEALAVLAGGELPVDVLLTDVIMPGMLGREVSDRVRESYPDVRVLYMSGFALPVANEAGHLDPGAALIDKPFTRLELLTALADAR